MISLTRTRAFLGRRPAAVDLLRLRDFRYFWLSTVGSDLGLELRMVATIWLALVLTDSPLWVGVVAGVRAVPVVALVLFAGAVTDRVDRRSILLATRVALGVLAFLTAYLATSGLIAVWHLVALAVAAAAVMAFGNPARQALVVDLVGRPRALAGNALANAAATAGEIFGPALAGYMIAKSGADTVFYAVAALYILSAFLMLRIRPRPRAAPQAGTSILRDIHEGLRYARGAAPIPALLLIHMTSLFSVAIMPMMPVYARDVLGVGAAGYGVMAGSMGLGFLVGSILTSLRADLPRKAAVMLVGGALWDIPMAAFAFSSSFPLSLALLFLMGAGGALWMNLLLTLVQTSADDRMRGRVMSLYTLASQVMPLGVILGGALAVAVANWFPLVMGAALGTPLAIVLFSRSPALRRA